ncbi:MAG: plasmid pRiA4b ORF-3 family protein [Cyanobacteria bacterium J06606_4]
MTDDGATGKLAVDGPEPVAYQLKITLVDSEPVVWRRVVVPAEVSLQELHSILQRAMGWENLHDYSFWLGVGSDRKSCDRTEHLSDTISAAAGEPIYYSYDPQSGWLHRIEVEALEVSVADTACLDGAAACPPEGSGGVWGYDELLLRLEDVEDPDYLELIEKYGDFDPDAFDLSAANARLAALEN